MIRQQDIPTIVYLLRKTNLTLKEIVKADIKYLAEIVREVQKQESLEEYNENYRTASIMAELWNITPRNNYRKLTANDFLPEREQTTESKTHLEKLAQDKNIIMPKYTRSKNGE